MKLRYLPDRRMFSSRVPTNLAPNRLHRLQTRLRASGADLVDLTDSNPTRVGLRYPSGLLDQLSAQTGLTYEPSPFGQIAARAAVATFYESLGIAVDPRRVVLTASTSEAYTLLFKLLCDPGDAVLAPRPSYPLFEHLARLDGVDVVPYAVEFHGRWAVNLPDLAAKVTPRVRAIIVVNPNNPTGSFLAPGDAEEIGRVCAQHGLALIADEVFGVYPSDLRPRGPSVLETTAGNLTFTLGGLSKAVGLPQLKLGWVVVSGADRLVDEALSRLELVCDTYLSVATPVQVALKSLLAAGAEVRTQIAGRILRNLAALRDMAAEHPAVGVLPVEGGWYAVLQVPATQSEESLVLTLLNDEHVLVHPGYFFDFPREAFLVLSLLPEPLRFDAGVTRMLAQCTRERLDPSQ